MAGRASALTGLRPLDAGAGRSVDVTPRLRSVNAAAGTSASSPMSAATRNAVRNARVAARRS